MLRSMLSQKKKIKKNRNDKVEEMIRKQIRENIIFKEVPILISNVSVASSDHNHLIQNTYI